jgi:tetratricopeptide (TPR) repeat protein
VGNIFTFFIGLWLLGCASTIGGSIRQNAANEVLESINGKRLEAGLTPLRLDDVLSSAAMARAQLAAEKGVVDVVGNRLPDLVKAGSFARFALSHGIKARSMKAASAELRSDPLVLSKAMHPRLSHMGLGFVRGGGGVFAVVDFARLVPVVDLETLKKELRDEIVHKREKNSVGQLTFDETLNTKADEIAKKFMKGTDSSDQLISQTQSSVEGAHFSLGRVTIAFQVAAQRTAVVVPAKISDPALALAGIGLAQGNHEEHDAGSLAVVLLLAEPQTAHDSSRKVTNLPPPKSAPTNKKVGKGSVIDRAWIATLSGNHRKAADLFQKAYNMKKEPSMLYETARAYARNEEPKRALAMMMKYASLVTGKEKEKVLKKIEKLEKGESIFSKSEEKKMSVEANRFFVIGQRLFEQGEWDGAVDAFQQAYTYSKHPDIIYNIGLAHCRAGRMGDALIFFGEYQKILPKIRSVEEAKQLFNIGVELYQVGQFEAASVNFTMAYGFAPFPELIYNLALCHKAMGQKEDAVRFLREFINGEPPQKERKEAEKMISELSQ